MPKKKTHNEFVKELNISNDRYIPLEEYKNNHDRILCRCKIHEIEFYSNAKRLLQGRCCCPQCNGNQKRERMKLTNDEFLQRLKDKHIDVIPLEEYRYFNTKIKFLCSCGNEWETTPARVLLGNHCKKCGYSNMIGENNYFL